MVERGGLENRCARKRTEGSNPSLSAIATKLLKVLENFEIRLPDYWLIASQEVKFGLL